MTLKPEEVTALKDLVAAHKEAHAKVRNLTVYDSRPSIRICVFVSRRLCLLPAVLALLLRSIRRRWRRVLRC